MRYAGVVSITEDNKIDGKLLRKQILFHLDKEEVDRYIYLGDGPFVEMSDDPEVTEKRLMKLGVIWEDKKIDDVWMMVLKV